MNICSGKKINPLLIDFFSIYFVFLVLAKKNIWGHTVQSTISKQMKKIYWSNLGSKQANNQTNQQTMIRFNKVKTPSEQKKKSIGRLLTTSSRMAKTFELYWMNKFCDIFQFVPIFRWEQNKTIFESIWSACFFNPIKLDVVIIISILQFNIFLRRHW